MTLLLDAAAVVDLLVRSDRGEQVRTALAARDVPVLFTVAHVDAEVFSALARQHSASPTDDAACQSAASSPAGSKRSGDAVRVAG